MQVRDENGIPTVAGLYFVKRVDRIDYNVASLRFTFVGSPIAHLIGYSRRFLSKELATFEEWVKVPSVDSIKKKNKSKDKAKSVRVKPKKKVAKKKVKGR